MGIVIIWLGHASFKIEAGGKTIYMDPYEGEYRDKADLILVSHSHADHCEPSKIGKIRKEGTVVIAPADCVPKIGGNVKTLKPGERVSLKDVTVEAVAAYNYKRFRSPGNPFHPKGFGVGYLVTLGDRIIYHAGDTDFIPEMRDLRNIYLALLPSGGTYTMDNPEAAEAALAIKPEFVIPMHRKDTNPSEFKNYVEAQSKIKVILLKPGEELKVEQ
jgi:L-ascorbate metabolism protein UlaG (beta-lactamase superfamily)